MAGVDGAGGDGESAGDAGAGTGPVDALTLAPRWGEVLTALEERTTKTYQADALEEVKAEFPRYFEALEQHPRLLVGQEVPRPDGKGMETLRDSSDAREWQEAIKAVLVAEIKDRASRKADEARPTLQVLHDAVGMLQNNPDLVPGTKQFDRELADRFVALAKPYEMRVDGKLYGYSIPVQPIITHLRAQLTTERAAKAAAAAAQPAQAAQAAQTAQAAQAAPAAQTAQTAPAAPQAGIPSKAGAGAEPAEDFSTLFGTIGLPNLRV